MLKQTQKGIAALAVLGAIAVGASGIAGAASNNGTNSSQGGSSGSNSSTARAPAPAGASHGPGETLLTGGTATKVKQAALGKVPGATVLRVETDAQGSAYEAHMQKSDGSQVTVKVNKQFDATDVESGFGAGGHPPGSGP